MADDDGAAQFGRQRLDALPERLALVGQRDLGALVGEGLGNAPGNGTVVGDTHDEAALAGHQATLSPSLGHIASPQAKRFLPIAQAFWGDKGR
jgi:hypothetical protein